GGTTRRGTRRRPATGGRWACPSRSSTGLGDGDRDRGADLGADAADELVGAGGDDRAGGLAAGGGRPAGPDQGVGDVGAGVEGGEVAAVGGVAVVGGPDAGGALHEAQLLLVGADVAGAVVGGGAADRHRQAGVRPGLDLTDGRGYHGQLGVGAGGRRG